MALLSQLFFSECLLGGLKEAMRRCPSQDRSNQPDYADVQPAPILVNGQRSSTLCTGRQWDRFLSWHWPVLSLWSASSHAWVLQSEVPVPPWAQHQLQALVCTRPSWHGPNATNRAASSAALLLSARGLSQHDSSAGCDCSCLDLLALFPINLPNACHI